MSKSSIGHRERLVSAVTLVCFVTTSVLPSIGWAAPTEDVRWTKEELAPEEAWAGDAQLPQEPPATRDKPAREQLEASDLRDAMPTSAVKPTEEITSLAAGVGDVRALALPSGGDKSGVSSQAISVPKGSGTVQGMGESFSAQLSTGIATFSVPFALPAARGGAQPSLGLSYSSASGSGLAGMGWSVGVPFIARQTDRGLPGYDDRSAWHSNQDRFVFNGGQELVPICLVSSALVCGGALSGEVMPAWSAGHQYFRARVEGAFLRFFWSPNHRTWRVQDKSGVTMELGVPLDGSGSAAALEVNPSNPAQIYRWHLVRQYDTYGTPNPASGDPAPVNVVVYRYFQNGGQAYLSDIYDTTPAANPTTTALAQYAHHTRLHYEERTDPTESYRSGWRIEQTQRLGRVDVTSKTFADGSAGARRSVRRYHLGYDAKYHTSYLASVAVEGRCSGAEADAPAEANEELGATNCARLPPMTFSYGHVQGYTTSGSGQEAAAGGFEAFDGRVRQMAGDPPHSVDEELTDYFDVNADGLPDVLVTAPGLYGNDYGVFFNSQNGIGDSFGAVKSVGVAGVLGANSGSIKLSNPNLAPLDLDGDGIVDFLHMPKVKTYSVYSPRLVDQKWTLVGRVIDAASKQSPKIDLGQDAAETRVADVNFDGLVDVVVSAGTEFQTFLSLGRLAGGDAQFGHGEWASASTANLSNEPVRTCVPYSGTPVRFSDSDIHLADMNGDGIQDIVRIRRGDFRYWPGRGNGFWGTGELDDCPAGSFGDKRYVTMASAPYYSDIQGNTLRIDDVNGDGLDDLVQLRFDSVDIWLNVDGRGWTQRTILRNTPKAPAFSNRVRLIDVNGSGTRDIVWSDGKNYQFLDLAGGQRPGLLQRVENGLGKSVDIEYASSTEEMLAAERTGQGCSAAGEPFERAWCSKMPTVTHLVKRVTESDNLSVAGSGVGRYVTEYSYRDPVYEGRQREFRGFARARSKRIGDANSPTDFTESRFLLGECEDETPGNGVDDCAVSERWRDNPKEALKGLPVITERYDENGVYLSTEATSYRLRHLYSGLDGRAVRHAFESRKRTTLYDTAAPTNSASVDPVAAEVQLELGATADLSGLLALSCTATGPAESFVATTGIPVPLRASSGYATTESASIVDAFGNRVIAIAKGCVAGSACPIADTGLVADETICSFTQPTPPLLATGWMYRTELAWSRGSVDTAVRGKSTTTYTSEGAPETTTHELTQSLPLERYTTAPLRPPAPAPADASTEGANIPVAHRTYDALGNLLKERGPKFRAGDYFRCRAVSYEASLEGGANYAQFPSQELIYPNGCEADGDPHPGNSLSTTAIYDRGLGLVRSTTDMTLQTSFVVYDGFGRLTQLFRPRPDGALVNPTTAAASVLISYDLPSAGSGRAYSIIHTRTQDGPNVDSSEYLQSYSYVDGMGRARVGLAEADPDSSQDGAPFIVSSIAELDAKGAVRRKYLPYFDDPDPSSFPVVNAPPDVPYGRQRYDAFGRQVQTFDVDGTVSLQSGYHALATDLWDAADLYPGPHQGSYASTRTDGHGRTVATTERVHVGGTLEAREVRTKYLASGQPQVITRVRVGATDSVVRWMGYDSLGRMVVNVDPHTTTPETYTSAPSHTTGIRAWHYVYNDAGDLVGTSDARGCGQNFVYDGAGRLKAEDYSPCISHHATYVAPSLTTGARYEVFYEYDDSASTIVTPPAGYSSSSLNLRGRLKAVHDRAATTWFAYDARGRTTSTHRRVSYIGAPVTTIAGQYVDRWYSKNFAYDAADRSVEETSGVASDSELRASDGTSAVRTAYTKRGALKHVDSSYGMLVSGIKRTADGLVEQMTFGDAAGTQTAMGYDTRRRLASVQTFRSEASLWSTAPPSISPEPGATDATRQLLLQDLDYSYDVVNNPIEIRDWRTPEEWPDGAKPSSRRMEYDDLYRVTRVDYQYPGGFDKFTSPYAPELNGQVDPRQAMPYGHKLFSKRPLWQTYRYDWLGNTTQTDDDQHAHYERSIGNITSNAATGKPYQLLSSLQAPTGGLHNGSITNVGYDVAGNLTATRVARSALACTTALSICISSRFFYAWDEVGRLQTARRIEGEGPSATGPTMTFAYDANDQRVIKEHFFNTPAGTTTPKVSTVYIFDSLELRRSEFSTTTAQYPVNASTEVAYLNANGMRLARLHYEPPTKGEPRLETPSAHHASNLHVLLNLPDHLGSTSLTIDHATGELVEARTYQPYGATESDYRPERWKGFREEYGFTGKEEDIEVGLHYFGKRYLSPYLGRWISADPLAVHVPVSADLNLYAYVRGLLLKATDPRGLADDGMQSFCATKACLAEDEAASASYKEAKATKPNRPPDAVIKGVDRRMRTLVKDARAKGLSVAPSNFEAYLNGTGNPGAINFRYLQSNSLVRDAQSVNNSRLVNGAMAAAGGIADGETRTFNDNFDRGILNASKGRSTLEAAMNPDLALASGPSALHSAASLQISRRGDTITITGTVEHIWKDRYDFHANKSEWIPGHGSVPDSDSKMLADYGNAAEFDMQIRWSQGVNITIRLNSDPAPGAEGAPNSNSTTNMNFGAPKEVK